MYLAFAFESIYKASKLSNYCSKPSPAEEVLLNGLRESRRNVLRLEHLKRQLEEAIEMEEKQFERFQFGLRRATADAAYIRTLQKMRAASKDAQDE